MTLRQLRDKVVEILQKEAGVEKHGVPAGNIEAGKINGNTAFTTPFIVVYASPKLRKPAESGDGLRIADITIFCGVEPETDRAQSEMNAVELAERIEGYLNTSSGRDLNWKSNSEVELDGTYPSYSVAIAYFQHSYISSYE